MEDRDPQFVAYKAIDYLERDAFGDMHPQFAFQTKINKNPDIFYWPQAIKQPDAKEFQKAALKEITGQTKSGLFKLVTKSSVPKGTLITPGDWSMLRKCRINTSEVYKWKARLAFDGSKQT